MVRKVDEIRMSKAKATAMYPDSYILMRMEDGIYDEGIVEYEADTIDAAYEKADSLENGKDFMVLEGINFYENYVGGVCVECHL
jgi:hypothetical protein